MKTVEQTLLERRSIRRYEREAISQESFEFHIRSNQKYIDKL